MLMWPHTSDLTAFCLNPCIGISFALNALCVLFLRPQSVLLCAWVWWCAWLAVLLPFWHFGATLWVCRGCPFLWTYKNIACAQNWAEAKPPIQIWFGYVFQLTTCERSANVKQTQCGCAAIFPIRKKGIRYFY